MSGLSRLSVRFRLLDHAVLRCCLLVFATAALPDGRADEPANCLGTAERERIHLWIKETPAGTKHYQNAQNTAQRNGYWAAFLFALDKDPNYLPVARDWLIKLGRQGGDLGKRALDADDGFFNQGQPWLGDIFYKTDTRPFFAYCWIYPGLSAAERITIEKGFLVSARFRMRAMDRWSHTPNLVFKPTAMVAMAGLITGDKELIDWGLYRKPWSVQGGYLSVLNLMLRDGGPWAEAPLYPLAHQSLQMMTEVSRLLSMTDGQDWFSRKSLLGGSPKGLVDYYIDSAYPLERTGYGEGQIRIASYGDGATSAKGDLFLVNPAGPGLHMHKELAAAYALSQEPRYAALLKQVPDYQPDLIVRPPLPNQAELPAAPSRVWPTYGLAMLRSDESPGYWTNDEAIAVFQIMSQGYGHDHRDKFSLMLHGAGRLLYPDYNAVQYENPAIGWTRNTIAHNTVMVDEQDTRNAMPTGIRHDFNPAVKFLATSADGVFETVEQTRILLLTHDYLLDVFQLNSTAPHTYDYLLHSFGRAEPTSNNFQPSSALGKRYGQLDAAKAITTDDAWALDFVIDEAQARRRETFDRQLQEQKKTDKKVSESRYGPEWFEHTAAVRVTMAGGVDTLVTHGEGPHELSMLVARRTDLTDTAFVAAHEPFSDDQPEVQRVIQLARSEQAIAARIEADRFTDYVVATFGPQSDELQHVLGSTADPQTVFAFKNYGYLRVPHDGSAIVARGGWTGFRIPAPRQALTINGQKQPVEIEGGYLRYGALPAQRDPPLAVEPTFTMPVRTKPAVARLFERDNRILTFTIENTSDQSIAGELEFELPRGFSLQPAKPAFGPIQPDESGVVEITLNANQPAQGRHNIAYRIIYIAGGEESTPTRTAPKLLMTTVGPVLLPVYRYPETPVYRVHAQRYTVDLAMQNGLVVNLADDADRPLLEDKPLFTFSDGEQKLLFEGTEHAFTWPVEMPASLTAHAYDKARWQAMFFGDRIMIRMNPDWTQFERAYFTVPGDWAKSAGKPDWRQVIVSVESGETRVQQSVPKGSEKIVAVELAFPNQEKSLCFQFVPPQKVSFTERGMAFGIGTLTGDQWTVGFCENGKLEKWRWKKERHPTPQ